MAREVWRVRKHFYPRPPGGGRRSLPLKTVLSWIFLSTPSGWRATLGALATLEAPMDFYPRPPGGGRRLKYCRKVLDGTVFLSTPSGWRATGFIHRRLRRHFDFYPRPPGGGRHKCQVYYNQKKGFLSTPSGWRATEEYRVMQERGFISIHALRVEGDKRMGRTETELWYISIHALRVEGDPRATS